MVRLRLLALLFAAAIGVALHGAAQTRETSAPPTDPISSGRDVYKSNCAPCHGYDGQGSGPVAGTLKTTPPDLTALATRNGGAFPVDRVTAFLATQAGQAASTHAVEEMQVRGPTWTGLDSTDAEIKTRIGRLVAYLATMQTEITMVAGTLVRHSRSLDLFQIGDVWLRLPPKAEFGRWLSHAVDRHVAIIMTPNAERFEDAPGVRILTGTLIHNTQPRSSPTVHELFLKDLMTGAFSAVTFETTNPNIARTFDFFANPEVSLIIKITQP